MCKIMPVITFHLQCHYLTAFIVQVKVILCLKMPTTSSNEGMGSTPCVSIGPRRKQITLIHPAPSRRRFGLTAPKMFTFDAVFTQDDPLVSYIIKICYCHCILLIILYLFTLLRPSQFIAYWRWARYPNPT